MNNESERLVGQEQYMNVLTWHVCRLQSNRYPCETQGSYGDEDASCSLLGCDAM